ncbi:hypothetical protein C8R46DRAFT_1194622, partial [Mycena filopes]
MGAYDKGFGVTLIATWLSTLLAGVALTHAVHYFAKFSNDVLFKKALDVVTHWGNPVALYVVPWPRAVSLPCISLIAFIVDQFLIHRFYVLSKNIWIMIILSMPNLVSVDRLSSEATHVNNLILSSSWVSSPCNSSRATSGRHSADLRKLVPLTDVWASCTGVTDVAIAACLVWTLRGMKTSFKDICTYSRCSQTSPFAHRPRSWSVAGHPTPTRR